MVFRKLKLGIRLGTDIIMSVIQSNIAQHQLYHAYPRKKKCTVYHVNLLKLYHCRLEYVNLFVGKEMEEIEEDIEIPYPLVEPILLNIWEIVKRSKLLNL